MEPDEADRLFAAFIAGFDATEEGFNGEYAAGCHNWTQRGHEHNQRLLERLRAKFDEWEASND